MCVCVCVSVCVSVCASKIAGGHRRQELYKRDFWRIFGDAIFMRQQVEGNRSKNFSKDQVSCSRLLVRVVFETIGRSL